MPDPSAAPHPRLRAAWIGGPLPAETEHLTVLGREVDLLVLTSEGPGLPASTQVVEAVEVRPVRAVGAHEAPLRWIYPELGKVLEAHRPDVVHVVSEPWGLLAVHAAIWVRRHPGTALVVHGCDRIWWHGGRLERLSKRLLAGITLRQAAGFCAETSAVAEVARSAGLKPGAPTAQIHTNPRDEAVFRPFRDEERRAGRERLGLPAEGVGVAFVGRMVPQKGVLLLLQAWASLPDEVRGDAWLAVAGEGPIADEVAALAHDTPGAHPLGLVSFPDGVLDLYRAAQVAAVPSYTEGEFDDQSPRAVIEGLMTGAVVVGSDSGGIPVMLGDTGILVRQRDVEDLARGLREALDVVRDPQSHARAAQAAVERGRAHYSTAAVAGQLLEAWTQVRGVSR